MGSRIEISPTAFYAGFGTAASPILLDMPATGLFKAGETVVEADKRPWVVAA